MLHLLVVEIDEIDEELSANSAREARRMPTSLRTSTSCKYAYRAVLHRFRALLTRCSRNISERELTGNSATQILPFSLTAERLELLELARIERVTVARFIIVWWQLFDELLNSPSLTQRVHVWDFIVWNGLENISRLEEYSGLTNRVYYSV